MIDLSVFHFSLSLWRLGFITGINLALRINLDHHSYPCRKKFTLYTLYIYPKVDNRHHCLP